jgi:lysophospholipase L1-like esterase
MKMQPLRRLLRPRVLLRQSRFAFVDRSIRRDRLFKRAILLTTCLVVLAILKSVPWGPYLAASIATSARQATRDAIGYPGDRTAIDESWRNVRRLGIEQTRPRVERFFADSDPAFQKVMRYAGMDPEHGLLRWGNYYWTLLLSSKVFEPDDEGRSYRLRPGVRSIWLRNLAIQAGTPAFYLVPDGPGLAEAIRGTTAVPLEASRQVTNSWGLRGPEPQPDAPLRGIVLGDSYMQGMFIGDDETPPECLRRYLQRTLKTRVSVLNAGVMGYSPEQYYASLVAFAGRFRPQFVVVSLYANDFGNEMDATSRGVGDWREGKYWVDKIRRFCLVNRWPCLIVAVPYATNMKKTRNSAFYPGTIVSKLELDSRTYLDPIDDFFNAHLQSRLEEKRKGGTPKGWVLFNDSMKDDHFSAAGAEVWAQSVGRRMVLLLEDDGIIAGEKTPGRDDAGSRPCEASAARVGAGSN